MTYHTNRFVILRVIEGYNAGLYPAQIQRIMKKINRHITIPVLHSTLSQMTKQGLVKIAGKIVCECCGMPKNKYSVTRQGMDYIAQGSDPFKPRVPTPAIAMRSNAC